MLKLHPLVWYCAATWRQIQLRGLPSSLIIRIWYWSGLRLRLGLIARGAIEFAKLWPAGHGIVLLREGTGCSGGTGVLLGDARGVFLGGGTGLFLGGGTRVILEDGTGVFLGGGSPLGVVDLGPPIDASKRFSVLAPRPILGQGVWPEGLEIALNMSTFLKSSLK